MCQFSLLKQKTKKKKKKKIQGNRRQWNTAEVFQIKEGCWDMTTNRCIWPWMDLLLEGKKNATRHYLTNQQNGNVDEQLDENMVLM